MAIDQIRSYVDKITALIAMTLLVVLCVLTWLEVFLRYLLQSPISWAPESSRYFFIWVVYLGTFMALKRGAHMKMDLIARFLPDFLRRILVVLNRLIVIAYTAIVFWSSVILIGKSMNQMMTLLPLPMGVVHLIIPISSFLMFFDSVLGLVSHPEVSLDERQQGGMF
jgi:TRAP-type C4-dicarboxylate transport system permease small subunit